MFKSGRVRILVALVVVVAFGGAGQAIAQLHGEVAHSAMSGSTLMPTTAQFGAWTHWIVHNPEFVELNVSGFDRPFEKTVDQSQAQGALHWQYDDNNHLLFRVRQFDLGAQASNFLWGGTLGRPMFSPAFGLSSVSDYNAYLDGQMINLALARPTGGGGAWSIGLLFADAGFKNNAADPEFEDKSTAFGGQVTWGNGDGLDLAASVSRESSTFGGGDAELESDFLNFDINARIARGNGWVYQLGFILGTGSVVDDDESMMGVIANVGRHLLQTDAGGVTAEFYVSYLGFKDEPVDEEEFTDSFLTVPGMRVAAWSQISRRFQVMGGANAAWSRLSEERDPVEEVGEIDRSWRGFDVNLTGGLAYTPTATFRIEGELDLGEVNNLLSLGNTTPLLARVGAKYAF
ncbi:MAG: hypothetical protein R6X25_07615 [Candidatus Krumholzibacteriia bacterium]